MLSQKLNDAGFHSKVIKGRFHIDTPDQYAYDNIADMDLSPKDAEYEMYNPLHYWVEINGQVLDITPDQFRDEIEEEIPDIVFGAYQNLRRYINYD
jgi:hypothetical protein